MTFLPLALGMLEVVERSSLDMARHVWLDLGLVIWRPGLVPLSTEGGPLLCLLKIFRPSKWIVRSERAATTAAWKVVMTVRQWLLVFDDQTWGK